MRVLVVRHDTGGANSWKVYNLESNGRETSLVGDLMAHLNTIGVSRIEIICEGE